MSTASKHRIPCPHCGQNMRIRNSQGLTPVYRVGIAECRNDACGFRGRVGIEVTNTITPSDTPNITVDLPYPPRMKRAIEAQQAS